jgi:hypothetical protein
MAVIGGHISNIYEDFQPVDDFLAQKFQLVENRGYVCDRRVARNASAKSMVTLENSRPIPRSSLLDRGLDQLGDVTPAQGQPLANDP